MLVRRVTFRKCLKKVDAEGGVSLRTRPGWKEVHPFDSSSIGEEAGCTLRRVKDGLINCKSKRRFSRWNSKPENCKSKEDFHTGNSTPENCKSKRGFTHWNSTPENCKSKRGFTHRNSRSSTISSLQIAQDCFRGLTR